MNKDKNRTIVTGNLMDLIIKMLEESNNKISQSNTESTITKDCCAKKETIAEPKLDLEKEIVKENKIDKKDKKEIKLHETKVRITGGQFESCKGEYLVLDYSKLFDEYYIQVGERSAVWIETKYLEVVEPVVDNSKEVAEIQNEISDQQDFIINAEKEISFYYEKIEELQDEVFNREQHISILENKLKKLEGNKHE